jgi:hypothetical protein
MDKKSNMKNHPVSGVVVTKAIQSRLEETIFFFGDDPGDSGPEKGMMKVDYKAEKYYLLCDFILVDNHSFEKTVEN